MSINFKCKCENNNKITFEDFIKQCDKQKIVIHKKRVALDPFAKDFFEKAQALKEESASLFTDFDIELHCFMAYEVGLSQDNAESIIKMVYEKHRNKTFMELARIALEYGEVALLVEENDEKRFRSQQEALAECHYADEVDETEEYEEDEDDESELDIFPDACSF